MLLREERVRRRRPWAIVLVAVVGCLALVPSAGASDVRHYEKVSPADKGQGDIVGDGMSTIAARAGDAVTFNSRTPFGDTIGSGVSGQTQFVARRGGDGAWATHAVTPTPRPDDLQTFFVPMTVQSFSDDLRTAVVWAYDLPGVDGDTPDRGNIYVEDTATRSLRPVTVAQTSSVFFLDFLTTTDWGMSDDAKHLALVPAWTQTQLLPNAAPDVPNVYQWDDGVLSLAGVLPDGSVPPTGSDIFPYNDRGTMSADGSRLVFTASPDGTAPRQLYMRIDGRRTVQISQPEISGPGGSDPPPPINVVFQAMTPDGHNVFFLTDSRLLDTDNNYGADIYRFTESADPAHDPGNLTLITNSGDVPYNDTVGGAVVGVSDDGERVYYHTISDRLAVWDHGTTTVIGTTIQRVGEPTRQLTTTVSQPGFGRVTPDGNYFAFITNATLGYDQIHALTGQITDGHYEMYLYSLADHRLACVSCPVGDATADVTVTPSVTSASVNVLNVAIRPHFLADDGRVFFSTTEALVPQDRNGVMDAYEYDPADGSTSLLSSGTGSNPSSFADASASGNDVFLVTRQKLVSADRDNLVDMYDARVGPALPETPTSMAPPCDGESCAPPPSASPPDDVLGTLTFDQSEAPGSTGKTFTVGRRFRVHGAVGFLRVRFLAPGTLTWRGKGLRAGSAKHARAGAYRISLRLGKQARAQLAKRGSYVTTLRLTFIGSDGAEVTRTARVTFRAAAKKGR